LGKESAAIGTNLSPGGEFKITARTRKDENQPAIETILVLVTDGHPAARTHKLAAL
jgi:hypothetical protein